MKAKHPASFGRLLFSRTGTQAGRQLHRAAALHLCLLVVICCVGCQHAVIKGSVTDAFDRPLEGVTVSIPGTQFSAATDQRGLFELAYAPGTFTVRLDKDGHIPVTRQLTIADKQEYPLSPLRVYRILPSRGIYAISDSTYVPLAPGNVTAQTIQHRFNFEGPVVENSYYASGQFAEVKSNNAVRFIENIGAADNTMLVKLGYANHIITRTKYWTKNPSDSYTSVRFTETKLGDGTSVIEIQNPPFAAYAFVTLGMSLGNVGSPVKGPAYLFSVKPNAPCEDCEKYIAYWSTADKTEYISFYLKDGLYRANGGVAENSQADFCYLSTNAQGHWLACQYEKPRNGNRAIGMSVEYVSAEKIKVAGKEYDVIK